MALGLRVVFFLFGTCEGLVFMVLGLRLKVCRAWVLFVQHLGAKALTGCSVTG